MIQTYNFKLEPYNYTWRELPKEDFIDERNGILCKKPTLDLECYYNYLDLLNQKSGEWKRFDYLDLGMMPLVMGPSFMQEGLTTAIISQIKNFDIQIHTMKPLSLLLNYNKLPFEDIWVFREDAAKLMGVSSGKVTAEMFLRWCFR